MGVVLELALVGLILYAIVWLREWYARHGASALKQFVPGASDGAAADTTDSVTRFLRSESVLDAELVVAIDCTSSNTENGRVTNGGRSLHDISAGADAASNPYQCALAAVAAALLPLDDDKCVAMYKFGDAETRGDSAALIGGGKIDCKAGAQPLLDAYVAAIRTCRLHGPTNFAPVIDLAAKQARDEARLHVLVILCDGEVTEQCWPDTCQSIINASKTAPLSIVIVGLGDGPWDAMRQLDDLRGHGQAFDNVHFVDFARASRGGTAHFAAEALKELPRQHREIARARLLGRRTLRRNR